MSFSSCTGTNESNPAAPDRRLRRQSRTPNRLTTTGHPVDGIKETDIRETVGRIIELQHVRPWLVLWPIRSVVADTDKYELQRQCASEASKR